MARRITSETLTCSSAARINRARLSSGSSRTDSTLAAADPSGGRPPARPTAQECRHVVAALGLIDRRPDIGVGDRRPALALSVVVHACSRLPFGSSRRYWVRIGMAWMTAGPTGRFLPERTFRGRQNTKLQYAVLAAAALHGGTEPDLLDEVAWWQTDDFWQYALFAAVACIRAAAIRAGVPVRQACQDLGERPGHPAP
jgi:hypothetical protein